MRITSKIYQSHRRPIGFTLIEVLVVMSIIAVLATLAVSGMSYYKNKVSTSKTRVFMGQIESALEQYHLDVGEYPSSNGVSTRDSTGVVYIALYGDGIGPDGIAGSDDDTAPDGDPDQNATIYLDALDPHRTGPALNIIHRSGSSLYLLADAWKDSLGYLCVPGGDPNLMNPPTSYDLWSAEGKRDINDSETKKTTNLNNWK